MTEISPPGIDGVMVHPLKVIADARGAVLHMLRADSPWFTQFGEIYFSEVNPGCVKAWKRHLRMTQRFVVPVGQMKFAIYDARPASSTRGNIMTVELGRPDRYSLLVIPPGLWYGFQNMASVASLIANCADMGHDPAESETMPATTAGIPFRWPE